MKIKISATYEGKCSLCNKDKVVFTAGNEDTKKVVSVCEDCANDIGDVPTYDIIKKYGKINESAFDADGISVKGLDKIQEELKKKQRK